MAVVHAEEGFGEFFGGNGGVAIFVEFVEVSFYEAGHGELVSSGVGFFLGNGVVEIRIHGLERSGDFGDEFGSADGAVFVGIDFGGVGFDPGFTIGVVGIGAFAGGVRWRRLLSLGDRFGGVSGRGYRHVSRLLLHHRFEILGGLRGSRFRWWCFLWGR